MKSDRKDGVPSPYHNVVTPQVERCLILADYLMKAMDQGLLKGGEDVFKVLKLVESDIQFIHDDIQKKVKDGRIK